MNDLDDKSARECIKPGDRCTIGPKQMQAEHRYVAGVECAGPDKPFKVFDTAGDLRGVFASWTATHSCMIRLSFEFEGKLAPGGAT